MALTRVSASSSFTRPNDTTQYTAGDLVANSATAGSVAMMSFDLSNPLNRPVWLRRVKITKTDPDITSASFVLWLHNDSAVTFSNGDNGAAAIASSTLSIGSVVAVVPVTIDKTLTGCGDVGFATFDAGLHLLPATVYGFLVAAGTYTPGAQEVFDVELVGEAYQ